MAVRSLGPVEMWECTTCKERYVGPREDKATKTWRANHAKKHWIGRRGAPEWEDQ